MFIWRFLFGIFLLFATSVTFCQTSIDSTEIFKTYKTKKLKNKLIQVEQEIDSLKQKDISLQRSYIECSFNSKKTERTAGRLGGRQKILMQITAMRLHNKCDSTRIQVKTAYLFRLGRETVLLNIKDELTLRKKLPQIDSIGKSMHEQFQVQLGYIKKEQLSVLEEIKVISQGIERRMEQLKACEHDLKTGVIPQITPYILAPRDSVTDTVTDIQDGVYERIESEHNRTIKHTVIVKDGVKTVYKMVLYNWGGAYYFKNDVAITKKEFDEETSP